MNRIKLSNYIIMLSIFISSCSTTKIVVDLTSNTLKEGISAFFEEDDLILARKGLESNLKLLEVFHKANKENSNLTTMLSQAYGGYTFVFLEADLLQIHNKIEQKKLLTRISKFYTRGLNYGLASIKQDSSKVFNDIEKNDIGSLEKDIKDLDDKDALFWTVFNWSLLLNLNRTSPDIIAQLPKIKILLNRMVELDETYFYGAPLALKGTLECVMPKMLGGRPKYGVELMEKALAVGNRSFLIVQMLYAQYCATASQNKEVFNALFDEINKVDYKINNDVVLINVSVKERADLVKKNSASLFIDEDE